MIDLHCHILPGLDDGADSWDTAVEMGRMAAEAGTEIAAATCHFNHPSAAFAPGSEAFWQQYREKKSRLEQRFREEGIPLALADGVEVFAGGNLFSLLKDQSLPTLNGTRYLLVETALDAPAFFIYRVLDRLLERDYIPVLAHPERYRCVQNVHAHVYEWYQMGALIQINKGSLLGAFGSAARRTADAILRHRLAAVAASDAHSCFHRTPKMDEFGRILAKNYGAACPTLLLEENPRRILDGRKVLWESPIPF